MSGTKETTEVVDFVIGLGMAIDKSMVDGKLDFNDVGLFVAALMNAGPAFSDMGLIPAELKDLDPAEAAALVEHVKKALALDNPRLEQIIGKSLEIATGIYALVQMLKAPKPADDIIPAVG